MALQISEIFQSGTGCVGKDGSDEYSANVWSTNVAADNADDPATIVRFAVPHFSTISALGNIIHNFRREKLGWGVWRVTAEYRSPLLDRQTNDAAFTFQTGGGTQHITHSRQTVQKYPNPQNKDSGGNVIPAPDYKGAINATPDSIEGVEIHVPVFECKTTFYVPPTSMTAAYVQQLYSAAGSVNSDTVTMVIDGIQLTFQSGELLYLGADGSKRHGFSDWELSLSWSGSPNQQSLSVGPFTGIVKNGWDYLWIATQQDKDSSANMPVITPIAAYVERVYGYQALSGLLQASSFGVNNAQPWLGIPAITGGGPA